MPNDSAIIPYIAKFGPAGIQKYYDDLNAQPEPLVPDNIQPQQPPPQQQPTNYFPGSGMWKDSAVDLAKSLATPPGTQDVANAVSAGFHAPVPTPEEISGKKPIPNIDRIPSAPGTTANPVPGQQTIDQQMYKNPNAGQQQAGSPLYQPNFGGGGGGGGNPLAGIGAELRRTVEGDIQNTRAASEKLNQIAVEYGDIKANLERDQALAISKYNETNNKIIADQQKRELEKQQRVDESMSRVQQARADYMATNIDPQGFWKSADGSTNIGKELGGVLAIALGSIASTMPGGTGGPNVALDMINKHIERNIDAQKANLEKKKYGITVAQGEYGMMRDLLGDEKQANLAARILLRDQLTNKALEISSNYGSDLAKQNANQLVAKLSLENAKDEAALRQHSLVQQADIAAKGASIGLQGAAQALEREKFKREMSIQDYMLKNKKSAVTPGLVTYGTPTTEQSVKANAIFSKYNEAEMAIKEAIDEQKNATLGGRVWASTAQKAAVNRAAKSLYMLSRGDSTRPGSDNPDDWYAIAGIKPGGSWTQTEKSLNTVLDRARSETNQKLKAVNHGLGMQEK
jgi:hypothetical protein